jgi:O-acetyl-ADP-ribose deacetylase
VCAIPPSTTGIRWAYAIRLSTARGHGRSTQLNSTSQSSASRKPSSSTTLRQCAVITWLCRRHTQNETSAGYVHLGAPYIAPEPALPRSAGGDTIGPQLSEREAKYVRVGPYLVTVHVGDIARLPFPVGAIVSSDDNYLSASGGVSAAILKVADDETVRGQMMDLVSGAQSGQEQSQSNLVGGQVVATVAGKLEAQFIFHCVAIDIDRNIRPDRTVVRELIVRCLELARNLGLASIAFPLVGAGFAGVERRASAQALLDALMVSKTRNNAARRSELLKVHVVAKTRAAGELLEQVLRQPTALPALRMQRMGSSALDLAEWEAALAPNFPSSSTSDTIELPPIVRLRDGILHRLGSNVEAIVELLLARGYAGEFGDQLLEYCLSDEPPLVLQRLLGIGESISWCKQIGVWNDNLLAGAPDEITRTLLRGLGMSLPERPRGITDSIRLVQSEVRALGGPQEPEAVTKHVVVVRSQSEALLRDMLRFHGMVLLNAPYESDMKRRGWYQTERRLDQVTFGVLAGILGHLGAAVSGQDDEVTRRFRSLFGDSTLLGDLASDTLNNVVRIFNQAVHPKNGGVEAGAARSACTQILDYMRYLQTSGIYPPVISVVSWTDDAYGQRLVNAIDDRGERHVLFTQQRIEPGHTYFMHPTTNPMRINPILVRLR